MKRWMGRGWRAGNRVYGVVAPEGAVSFQLRGLSRCNRTLNLNPELKLATLHQVVLFERLRVSGEVPRGEKMLYSGTDPESFITEYT